MRNHTLQANVTSVCNANFPIPISTYFDIFLFMLSVLTFIVGVTSWTFIKKFRLFKNYILLSIIFNNATNAAIRNINVQCYFENATNLETVFIIYFVLYIFFRISLNYWLLILCYVFYLDLAKVYNNHISRRYLKANLFGWVLPLIVTIFNSIVMKYITKKHIEYALPLQITAMFIPLMLNLIIYLTVVVALVKKKANNVERRRCFLLLTVLLCLSGIFMLTIPLHLLWDKGESGKNLKLALSILSRLQDLMPIVYLFTLGYNWSVWKDYYRTISKRRKDHESLRNISKSSLDQI